MVGPNYPDLVGEQLSEKLQGLRRIADPVGQKRDVVTGFERVSVIRS